MAKDPKEIAKDLIFEKRRTINSGLVEFIPGTIYHYTTTASFIGIIEQKQIWASRAEFLNDATEFRYGQEICKREMNRLVDSGSRYKEFVTCLSKNLDFNVNSPFVTCFCKDGDLLSQWRAYSSHGQGLAIGFNPKIFETMKGIWLNNIIYSSEDQSRFVFEHIKAIADSFVTVGLDLNDSDVQKELIGYTGAIERYCVLIKDPAFREENELRISVTDFTATIDGMRRKFRAKNNLIVPYIEIDLGNEWASAVEEVIIGPGPDPELRRKNVMHFLDLVGLGSVPVSLSKCQYRQ